MIYKNKNAWMYHYRKDAWCEKYFPEFYTLFKGYPPSIPVQYGRQRGRTSAVEMRPWWWGSAGIGEITPYCRRKIEVPFVDRGGMERIKVVYETVEEDEFVDWCDKRNYFRNGAKTPNGGPGLHPDSFVGAEDLRNTREYWSKYPNVANHITCWNGKYYYGGATGRTDPFGTNAFFVPTGRATPSYIQDKEGPDYAPDAVDSFHNLLYPDAVRGDQDEYNKERWSAVLSQ